MVFDFEGRCVLQMAHEKGMTTSKHVQTKINLDCSKNLNRSQYLDKEDLPTADGAKVLTNVFVQGLVANIHSAHQKGYWNDAEHIRYIISELERGFVENAIAGTSTF
jgi:hypothetical protein